MFILYLSHVVSEKKQDVSYGSCGLEDEARLFFKAIYTKTQQRSEVSQDLLKTDLRKHVVK